LKLADFGHAATAEDQNTDGYFNKFDIGTKGQQAPEIVLEKRYKG